AADPLDDPQHLRLLVVICLRVGHVARQAANKRRGPFEEIARGVLYNEGIAPHNAHRDDTQFRRRLDGTHQERSSTSTGLAYRPSVANFGQRASRKTQTGQAQAWLVPYDRGRLASPPSLAHAPPRARCACRAPPGTSPAMRGARARPGP